MQTGEAKQKDSAKQRAEMRPKGRCAFLPANLRGIFFDLATAFLNIFLMKQLASQFLDLVKSAFQDEPSSTLTLSIVAGVVLLLRFLGLYFKRRPLQARLQRKSENSLLGCFGFFNFGLMALTMAVAMAPIMGYAENLEVRSGGRKSGAPLVISLSFLGVFLLFFESYLFLKALSPLKSEEMASKRNNWRFSRQIELFADFGLFTYMILWQVIYFSLISSSFTSASTSYKFSTFIVFSFIFIMCYLTPRALFFVEDGKSPAARLSIAIAFLPSAIRILF